jgi:PAS domain S-box-containing protein
MAWLAVGRVCGGRVRYLRFLIVVANLDDVELIGRALRTIHKNVEYRRVDCEIGLRDALAEHPWDAVLSDFAMPKFDGMAALEIVRSSGLAIPFILVSGAVGEEVAAAAVKAGANDYVMKSNLLRLPSVLERELRDTRSRVEHAHTQQKIHEVNERNRAIITTAPDGIITFDLAGTIESFNPAAARLFGMSEHQAAHARISDLVPTLLEIAASSEAGLCASNRLDVATGIPALEAAAVRPDGSTFPVEVSISAEPFGEHRLHTAIVHDISRRKEAEALIWTQFERLTALRAIDVAVTGSFDLRVTLQIVVDQVIELLCVDAADVLLADRETGALRVAAHRGFREQPDLSSATEVWQNGTQPRPFENCMTEIIDLSTGREFHHRDVSRREGFIYYCSVPLVSRGHTHGLLEVFHRNRRDVDADWMAFLETLAGQAAIVIDSRTLLDDLQRHNAELTLAYDVTIEGWARALDLRDRETEGHSRRVADLAVELARAAGVAEEDVSHIRRGALLHDIGKLGVPDSILLKQGPLTDEEWTVMHRHPQYAHDWLSPITFLHKALAIPYSHHERWDGRGYPQGLSREQIALPARLFALVDVWDALTSDRPYRSAWTPEAAADMIRAEAGSHFDPNLVPVFLAIVMPEVAERDA